MLEHDVDTVPRRLPDSLAEGAGVERGVGAKLQGQLSLRLGTARCEHPSTQVLGDSYRRHRHPRSGAHDEHGLVRPQLGAGGQHPPCGQKCEGEGRRLFPRQGLRLGKEVARVNVDELAGGAVGVLAQHAKAGAFDVFARAAPLALPAAQGGEEDDLIARLPRWIVGGVDDTGAIRRDHSRRCDALRAVGQPEVQVVDRRRLDRHGYCPRFGLGAGPLADSHAGRAYRLLVDRGLSLAQNLHVNASGHAICES